ncbi:M16 family metallopeptidase [Chondromyces apiculatus]|uniref:Uncharacterized protein n=1 Tax=Chondromyces apiculatus DSM 436 TaxID=1192034 RepID=A0A017TDW8_9BACT|nr:pitrilysin family protein [Chondromyces apiculatus]EYF06811.1 Hypothetical protein CAP_1508 [Chondromyces apiculatus DSM 436]
MRVAGLITLGILVWAGQAQAQDKPQSARAQAQEAGGQHPKGEPKAGAATAGATLKLPVQRERLDNGLRVVMSVDHSAPTVAVAITYDVGSADEPQGKGGMAWLAAQMMFEGSKNVAAGEHRRLVAARGGQSAARVSADLSSFVSVLPAGDLELALWLEADRMRALKVSEASFAEQRRAAVAALGAPDAPGGSAALRSRLGELVFEGYAPYAHPARGTAAALESAEIGWVREIVALYGPERAVLSVVGDVEPAQVMALVRRHFAGIAAHPAVVRREAVLPEQTGQRTAVPKDGSGRLPALIQGWAVPPMRHADYPALTVAAEVLGGGEGARLHRLLVLERGMAREARAGVEARRGPGLLAIEVGLLGAEKVAEAEKTIGAEIQALATRGPGEVDLARAKTRACAEELLEMQPSEARAVRLGEAELLLGDAGQLGERCTRLGAVSREDVQRVVRAYLTPARSSVVEVAPRGGEESRR